MSRPLNKEEQKVLREIAKFYGCGVRFLNFDGGLHCGDYIKVGLKGTLREQVSVFCHELAHFINYKTGRYPLYHDPKYFGNLRKQFKSYKRLVRYALNAEILTERIGKELCKEWFPNIKYDTWYKNTKECHSFISGYYFRD